MHSLRFNPLWFVWLVEFCFFKASSAFFWTEVQKMSATHLFTKNTYFNVVFCTDFIQHMVITKDVQLSHIDASLHFKNNYCDYHRFKKDETATVQLFTFFLSLAYFFCRASSSSVSELGNTTMVKTAARPRTALTAGNKYSGNNTK